jgi:uncharacterized RDD family membrane protein YckC
MKIQYPLLIDRFQSVLIDSIVIILLMFILSSVIENFATLSNAVRILLFFVLWAIYEPLATTLGFTLGNYIAGIRVRNFKNMNMKIDFFRSFIRFIIKVVLGWLSLITIFSNKERRALHDLVSGSVMIKV